MNTEAYATARWIAFGVIAFAVVVGWATTLPHGPSQTVLALEVTGVFFMGVLAGWVRVPWYGGLRVLVGGASCAAVATLLLGTIVGGLFLIVTSLTFAALSLRYTARTYHATVAAREAAADRYDRDHWA